MSNNKKIIKYSEGIREGFEYLLSNYEEVCLMGQGLWSPWYVGNTMNDLEKQFGKERILDTPVSENSTTGMALGAALTGLKTVVVHPRMDFMILASDQIVNQASKWQSMLGGGIEVPLTIRGIINRGGEQGAQHSQALQSWYAHIPGLRVVMPSTPLDARDLLISSVLCNDPVLYIDDRWCYDQEEEYLPPKEIKLQNVRPTLLNEGDDLTIVTSSYSTLLSKLAIDDLKKEGINIDLIDLRVLNPLNIDLACKSVQKTGRLLAVDGGWLNYGVSAEIIASISERVKIKNCLPQRLALKSSPAPTSKYLEKDYYLNKDDIIQKALSMINP